MEKGLRSQRMFTSCLSSSDEISNIVKNLTSRDRKKIMDWNEERNTIYI